MSIRTTSFALMAGLSLAAPMAAVAAPQPVAVQVEKQAAPAPAAQQDASGYATREAQDKQVANYEGGNTVVIAMSGTAFVVLLLLLILI
jgi:hypothetical protein